MPRPKKIIEESLGVASTSDIKKALAMIEKEETQEEPELSIDEIKEELISAKNSKRALKSMESHDMIEREDQIDSMSDQCLSHFEDIIDKAFNAEDKNAAEMFNAANALLKTALDAKRAIIDARLKMEDLRLKELKLSMSQKPTDIPHVNDGVYGDRNSIRKKMNK